MFVLIGYFQYQISSEQTNIANSQIIPQFILTCSYQNPDGKEVDLQPYTNDIITVQNKGGIAQELKAQVSVIFSLEKSLPSKTKEITDFYVSNYYLTHRINLSNDSPTIVFYGYKNNERFHKYSNKIYEENIKNNIVVSVIRKRYLKLSIFLSHYKLCILGS